jgi:hypothetical protein
MPLVTKRLLGGYLIMVGIPVVVIAIVMHVGGALVAPPSINGDWIMQWETPDAAAKCEDRLPDGSALAISQSGRHLTAHWNQNRAASMRGTLDNGHFTLCSLGSSSEECSYDPLHLSGRILEENGSRRLEVRLDSIADDCKDLVLLSSWRRIDLTVGARQEYNY